MRSFENIMEIENKVDNSSVWHYSLVWLPQSVLRDWNHLSCTQKMQCSVKEFFRKCEQSPSLLRICSHLPKKNLIGKFLVLCSVAVLVLVEFCYLISNECFLSKLPEIIKKAKYLMIWKRRNFHKNFSNNWYSVFL